MVDSETLPRPRRTRNDSAKHYDSSRRDLQLTEVLNVLQRYVDYGGGINCCVCGKLYKSRVCFIKHLWEHTVYWDLFAGDKNHMRVLSIQAALILYGSCQQPLCPVPVDSLLVTSPQTTEHNPDGKTLPSQELCTEFKPLPSSTPSCSSSIHGSDCRLANKGSRPLLLTPPKQITTATHCVPKAPVKKSPATDLKRKAPSKLNFVFDGKDSPVILHPQNNDRAMNVQRSPSVERLPLEFFHTPVKQRIPCRIPKTPRKKKVRSLTSQLLPTSAHRRVSRFLLPSSSDTSSDEPCWKETDSDTVACKRKRAE